MYESHFNFNEEKKNFEPHSNEVDILKTAINTFESHETQVHKKQNNLLK